MKYLSQYMRSFMLVLCLLLTAAPGTAEEPALSRARVIFTGDIMAHAEQLERPRALGTWDFTPQFRRVKPLFYDALAVGNLETVFAGGDDYSGYPMFNTPDGLALSLSDLGIDVLTLATNHILDKGYSGAARTADVLDSAGIFRTGLGYGDVRADTALAFERGGIKWAFVNYAYGSNRVLAPGDVHLNTISDEAVISGLNDARLSSPDITIACFHWGNEYQYVPTKRQRAVAELCLDNGADLVIGTHPHVLQPVEIVRDRMGARVVAYSLGNFISYQRTLPRERSVILAVDFEKKAEQGYRVARVSAAPVQVLVTRRKEGRLFEAVYAGESPRFNHAGLDAAALSRVRGAGKAVLDFLGARGEPDAEGFYTIWDAASPDILPKPGRKAPI